MTSNDDLFSQLIKVECPDSTYRPKSNPIVLARAKGSLVFDAIGNRYIDLCAGFGVLAFGHNPQYVLDLMADRGEEFPQILHGLGDVYPSVDKIEFLSQLFSVLPSYLKKAALALTGSQAIELAIKTAMMKTKKRRFLAFEGSYHGLDLGVLPVTFRDDFRAPFSTFLRDNNAVHLSFGCDPSLIEHELKLSAGTDDAFAGIIVEPVQGRGGVRPAEKSWLKSVRALCTTYNALLIFDEVFTGFGRTGKISFTDEVEADITCFGKAIGGGMPLSVCVGSEEAMNAWPSCESEALHTGTFFGHPLSCRFGSATISQLKTKNIITSSSELGNSFREHLKAELSGSPLFVGVRGVGMMTGLQFSGDSTGAKLMDLLRAEGVIAIPSGANGNVLSLTPALNIHSSLLEEAAVVIKKCVKKAH
jgi:4-aminobutyrate aminotransferase/(S)-3-amino-2-methylpropionate transaminase